MTEVPYAAAPTSEGQNQDDFVIDDEVERLSMMLSSTELKSMDWADTLECAPRAIGIIGECLLLSSHERAAAVQLDDDRLSAKTLPANLRQCAITGKSTFEVAASRMRNISSQALLLSRDGTGIIDRITKFACKEQTSAVARELEAQKNNLKRVVAKCSEDARTLQEAFKKWNEETLVLLQALNIGEDQVHTKVDTVATKLVNTEMDLDRLKKQLGFEGINLAEIEQRLINRTEASEATSVAGGPLITAGFMLHMLGAAVGGPIILGASLAIWGRVIFAQYTQMKRDGQVRELQQNSMRAQTLDQQIQQLSSASCTLQEMRAIVTQAVRQILQLQDQVETLLGFFQAIFERVESLDQYHAKELERHVTEKDYKEDDDIKQIMVENALDLKISFTFIGRLADMYSKISARYLLPGMQTVQLLGLSDDSRTPAQLDWKRRELETFKRESVENVRRMTIEQQDQLNTDMVRLMRTGILSLRTVSVQ